MLVQTVYLGAWAAFTVLSLPAGGGRLGLDDADFLRFGLSIQIVAVIYLSSAVASSEIAAAGEKGVADLALSAFSPRAVALGKLLSGAGYAAYLVAVGLPFAFLSAGLWEFPARSVAWAAAIGAGAGTAAGVWGAWLGGRVAEGLMRGILHWTALLVVLWGAYTLPFPWSLASPLAALDLAIGGAPSLVVGTSVAFYLAAAGTGAAFVAARVRCLRLEESDGQG